MHPIPSFFRSGVARPPALAGMVVLALAGMAGCGGSQAEAPSVPMVQTSVGGPPPKLSVVAAGLDHPWSLAFLPDGSMLVTERVGRLRHLATDGRTLTPSVRNLPPVFAEGQGGLLDIAVDPDHARNGRLFWCFSEAGTGDEAGRAGTAVARGRLAGDALQDVQVIFRQSPKVKGSNHFGCRLVFANDGTLFVTLGERMQDDPGRPTREHAQNLGEHLGKVVRIRTDGSPAPDNPRFATPNALPQIWSLGHRNPQGAALHPVTRELWVVEHGPRGGDEVNRVLPGHNYGWPLRSYGCPYTFPQATDACRVGGGTHAPDFDEPLTTWLPVSTAPSGMAFYTGDRFPAWKGSLFIGALADRTLWRLTLDGNRVVARESLFADNRQRIRDVRQGPDGWLYLLTDESDGRVLRLSR